MLFFFPQVFDAWRWYQRCVCLSAMYATICRHLSRIDAEMSAEMCYTAIPQSAWCLGNIAGDCVELRDIVLGAGVMEALLDGLSPSRGGSSSFMR